MAAAPRPSGASSDFGRVDAVYGPLECQKPGAYHLHGQLFVHCVHRFTPLQDLMDMGNERMLEILRRFSDYTAHVRRMVYCDLSAWRDQREEVEAERPAPHADPPGLPKR